MFIFCCLILATIIATVGYFVLFAAGRTEGGLHKFGRILAVWIFVLAALPVLAGGYMAVSGHPPMGKGMHGYMWGKHGGHHGEWRKKMHGRWEKHMRQHIEEMHGEKK